MSLVTYGAMPKKMPKGFAKAVHFPTLAVLDTPTGDHRMLSGQGGESRQLPLSIRYQTQAADGHGGARVSGALFEVTFDPENKLMSGKGFLLDDDNGREHARLIFTGAMKGNSVDLAEIRARLVEDFESGEWWIEFSKFKLAATTGVATPAFADARAEIPDGMSDEELTASAFGDDPMAPLVSSCTEFSIRVLGEPEMELTASAGTVPFDDFYIPESSRPQKAVVDADGRVFGHLALWESCHDGFADRCMRVPRPNDNYASFNKPGPLTERGQVQTGPIFAYGGHRPLASAKTVEDAYGGIENTWADVRITEGVHGPWISGRVRLGVDDETLYAVRASRLSGHWLSGKLKAIVSVNAEGFDVPGDAEAELVAGFAFATDDNGVCELVASFPSCADGEPSDQLAFDFASLSETMALIDERVNELMRLAGIRPEEQEAPTDSPLGDDILLASLLEDDRDD